MKPHADRKIPWKPATRTFHLIKDEIIEAYKGKFYTHDKLKHDCTASIVEVDIFLVEMMAFRRIK